MKKNFNFEITPILTLSEDNMSCTLIKIDELNLLFDCGWDENFNPEVPQKILNSLKSSNSKIDYIFLSHNSISSFGSLPILIKDDLIKDATIYTTTPISKLGFYSLIDALISKIEKSEFDLFNDTEIDQVFKFCIELKYKQNAKLHHNGFEIIITPIPSGMSLGGCAWKIFHKLKTIIYCPQICNETKK